MFDIWVSQEEPALHLVVREGGQIPPDLAGRDWSFLGQSRASTEIGEEVEQQGFSFVECSAPFDPAGILDRGR